MVYLYDACDQISDFCHQQLLRKMRISWTDGRTDRGKTVYPSPFGERGYNYDIIAYFLCLASCSEHFISIKHRILATFNINKTNQFERLYAFKLSFIYIFILHMYMYIYIWTISIKVVVEVPILKKSMSYFYRYNLLLNNIDTIYPPPPDMV